jgi:hypothetical protein
MTGERARKTLIFVTIFLVMVLVPAVLQAVPVTRYLLTQPAEGQDLLINVILIAIATFPAVILLALGLAWFFAVRGRSTLALLLTLLPLINLAVVYGGNRYAEYTLSQWVK